MTRAVFLDRDGVVNRSIVRQGKPYAPTEIEQLEILPGVADAIRTLRAAGFRTIVVTNQPDVATGRVSESFVQKVHARIAAVTGIDEFRACFHVDADACACRKPKPGMLLDAAREGGINLGSSYMIGDRWRDIDAGRAAGCRTLWIETDYAEKRPRSPDATISSLADGARLILNGTI